MQVKLFRAIQKGNTNEVERLLVNKMVNVNKRHDLGWTPLHLAAVNGRQEVADFLFIYFLQKLFSLFEFQIVNMLITAGSEIDAEEEFMNVYTTARDKKKHSLEVQIAREDEFCDRLSPR